RRDLALLRQRCQQTGDLQRGKVETIRCKLDRRARRCGSRGCHLEHGQSEETTALDDHIARSVAKREDPNNWERRNSTATRIKPDVKSGLAGGTVHRALPPVIRTLRCGHLRLE